MYFDVPATAGCQNLPNVILQTHMDMVVSTDDSLGEVDPLTMTVDIAKDEDTGTVHAKDFKTNCGADDGAGIGVCLAIAKNKNISHGPLRFLFTTAEEIGCMGSKFVPAEFLNADYLINIDGCRVGEVDISSAGYLNADYFKTFSTTGSNASTASLKISVSDLEGGHSGVDIAKPRKSAVSLFSDILNEASQIDANFQIAEIECGNAYNAIPATGEFCIVVDASKANDIKGKIEALADAVKKTCADEKNVKIKVEAMPSQGSAISATDSKTLQAILKDMPNGLIKMSEIQEGTAESSANIGFLSLKNGSLRIGFSARSNSTEYLETLNKTFVDIQNKYSLDYKLIEDSVVPAWPTTGDNALSKLYLKGLRDECGLEGYESILHGAVEPARFVDKHPGMLAICIGLDVQDEHMVTEAWYTKSASVTVAGILNVLDNIVSLTK